MVTETIPPTLEFDDAGFLKNPHQWNESLAERIAEHDGLGTLTDRHWSVIRSLRAHYLRCGAPPAMHHICHLNHLGPDCVDRLFGHGALEAWRIAGLPDPGEEAKTYM
ncbi:MAG: TusE/DsrC/DsvC family sulfur relay protein [Gammaproteobacteria bacterium]